MGLARNPALAISAERPDLPPGKPRGRVSSATPSVTRVALTSLEARERADRISNVSYRIDLDLTSRESFACRTPVTFDFSDPRATTFLELAHADDLRLVVNDHAVSTPTYDGRRITLHDLAPSNEVVVE